MSCDEQLAAESETPTELSPDDLQKRLEEAEQRVESQNALVQELTERLESAAEQLDRLQRMGVERGEHVRGFPKAVVDEQAELIQEMSRVVEVYGDVRTAEATASLQMQIEELREYLEEQFRLWNEKQEAEKAAEAAESEELSDSETVADEEESSEPTEQHDDSTTTLEPLAAVDPPEIVDVNVADDILLQDLINRQNKFIDYLTARVDRLKNETAAEDDATEVASRNEQTDPVADLEEAIRFADYEIALQRQITSRKEARLTAEERRLEERLQELIG